MAVKVLIVDDSLFFRRRLTEIFSADPRLAVVDTAGDGAEAVDKAGRLRPDVITMDVEMPVMDGIEAVRRITSNTPTPILMFSSLTRDGARATLDALDAGAVDFLPKRLEDIAGNYEEAARQLCDRVVAIARRRSPGASGARVDSAPVPAPRAGRNGSRYGLVLIGTSTGGPLALQSILQALPGDFPAPLLLVQHMPATFTPAFAQRLDQHCALSVREAADGDRLEPGVALLAPGGRQMAVCRGNGTDRVRIRDSRPDEHYKPSVDVSFTSGAEVFGDGLLGIVLTGMGADGREGARRLKECGGTVWAQDEQSCVIYGMPMAVVEAGLADRVVALNEISGLLTGGR